MFGLRPCGDSCRAEQRSAPGQRRWPPRDVARASCPCKSRPGWPCHILHTSPCTGRLSRPKGDQTAGLPRHNVFPCLLRGVEDPPWRKKVLRYEGGAPRSARRGDEGSLGVRPVQLEVLFSASQCLCGEPWQGSASFSPLTSRFCRDSMSWSENTRVTIPKLRWFSKRFAN